MKKRFAAAALAVLLFILSAVSVISASAYDDVGLTTPAGYDPHDYRKLLSFLEREDDAGIKNGEKLSENYDPDDPDTWSYTFTYTDDDGDEWTETAGVVWMFFNTTMHVRWIRSNGRGIVGTLDISDCSKVASVSVRNELTRYGVPTSAVLTDGDASFVSVTIGTTDELSQCW